MTSSYHNSFCPTSTSSSGHAQQQFPSMNASGGGITLTTPTLTPTTLKRIQDSFLDQENREDIFMSRASQQHQGGFVPPIVNITTLTMSDVNNGLPTSATDDDESSRDSDISTSRSATTYNQALESNSNHSLSNDSSSNYGAKKVTKARNSKKSSRNSRKEASKLSPDEQVRRQVRRERNKLAAARCRKRRMDHTNELTQETEVLENEQSKLRRELQELKEQQDLLLASLDGHRRSGGCKFEKVEQSTNRNFTRRPNSLPLTSFGSNAVSSLPTSGDSLVPIQTPSNGISLEGLMDGTAGLTPLLSTPSAGGFLPGVTCSGQQRTSSDVLPRSETGSPTKLVSL